MWQQRTQVHDVANANRRVHNGVALEHDRGGGGNGRGSRHHRNGHELLWTAVSNSGVLRITTGGSGTGTGIFIVTVDPNTTGSARSGTVVAGVTLTITQPA